MGLSGLGASRVPWSGGPFGNLTRTVGRLVTFLFVVVLGGVLVAASLVLVAPQVGTVFSAGDAAPAESLDLDPLAQRSVVLAADGSLLDVLYKDENRVPITLDAVPKVVIDTVLAVEDPTSTPTTGSTCGPRPGPCSATSSPGASSRAARPSPSSW